MKVSVTERVHKLKYQKKNDERNVIKMIGKSFTLKLEKLRNNLGS